MFKKKIPLFKHIKKLSTINILQNIITIALITVLNVQNGNS